MKNFTIMILLVAMALFAVAGCGGASETDNADEIVSSGNVDRDIDIDSHDEDVDVAEHSDEDSDYDAYETDINYDNLAAGIPEGFPDVIPVYDPATVLGGTGQDAGGTMIYNLVIGSDDQLSDVAEAITGSVDNIDMNIAVEGSLMLMGYMDDWDYTISVDDGEADGYSTVITYTIVERP
ncbi:MAG: hypothetical protein KAH54_02175 [Candidatus Sabulitectum sp.]|nr:hypothetical protein [Candidatus Sabulitectum sp.]